MQLTKTHRYHYICRAFFFKWLWYHGTRWVVPLIVLHTERKEARGVAPELRAGNETRANHAHESSHYLSPVNPEQILHTSILEGYVNRLLGTRNKFMRTLHQKYEMNAHWIENEIMRLFSQKLEWIHTILQHKIFCSIPQLMGVGTVAAGAARPLHFFGQRN